MRRIQRILLLSGLFLLTNVARAQSHSVSLAWTPATQPSGITIASWNVLRGTTTGGPYTQIANMPVATTAYTDSSVSSGQTYFYVVQTVDTSGGVSANSSEVQAVIPTSPPPLSISTTSLPSGIVGSRYSATITASGGTAPYTWSGTGADGLTLSTTGMLSGTPAQPGTFMQAVMVTDSASVTASASLTLAVVAPLAISTAGLPSGTVGGTYNATLNASGGTAPYTWSGAGTDGLTLSAAGVLSGAPAQPGTFMQSVAVYDSAGLTANATLSLTVTSALTISTASLPPATTAKAGYSATLTASGGTAPYTWSGTGVDGLVLSAAGVLSGTPSGAGTFTQTVTVRDSVGATASRSLTLSVAAPLVISTTSLLPAVAQRSYTATFTATGGTAPYAWAGTGVDGLTLSASGVLSGTPSLAGTFTQSVTLTDSAGATASASLTLTVAASLAISTASLPSGTVGGTYSATLAAMGGTPPYTWSGAGVDGLAPSTTGVLSGTPSGAGMFALSVTVKDSAGATATASFSVTITAALAISTTSLLPATAQGNYSATFTATGGTAPYTWSGTGADGLILSATGVLSEHLQEPERLCRLLW